MKWYTTTLLILAALVILNYYQNWYLAGKINYIFWLTAALSLSGTSYLLLRFGKNA
ncbi:MAG TPA: hypothetical protein VJK51_02185 [Candidatus Nanoarchaeia archaeon]|nr:hypothetical protein [Candidatus Nanoarchaeia archaeon]